jgi:hypothetical protein
LSLFAFSWIQGTTLFVGWLCVYFFYHLFDRFNRSEIERLRLATSVKEAELRALKSQINPHFIFNSLNSLRGLIDENPDRARQAVTQLANLLRYSLQSGQLETVPFEDELHTVNDYLALEQVRHEERLRVRLDVEPGVLNLPIPPMLLQTLVEDVGENLVNVWAPPAPLGRRDCDRCAVRTRPAPPPGHQSRHAGGGRRLHRGWLAQCRRAAAAALRRPGHARLARWSAGLCHR